MEQRSTNNDDDHDYNDNDEVFIGIFHSSQIKVTDFKRAVSFCVYVHAQACAHVPIVGMDLSAISVEFFFD